MAKTLSLEEFEAFMRQVKWIVVGVVVLFFIPMVIYAIYMDQRLSSLKDSLRYRPPQEVEEYTTSDGTDCPSVNPMQGQVVYVPAYSHIYHQDGRPCLLTITLSVRNTSLDHEMVGKFAKSFRRKSPMKKVRTPRQLLMTTNRGRRTMPTILQVNFPYAGPFGDEMTESLRDLAASICVEPGFLWKIWTISEESEEAGGIYLFADGDAAEAYASKHSERLKQMGVKSINAKVFHVQMPLTSMTRGPVRDESHQTARETKS